MNKRTLIYKGGAALLFGALLPLGFSPFNVWPLVLVSLLGWQWLIQNANPRQAFWQGWCYGFGAYTLGVCWVFVSIHQYGHANIVVAGFATLALTASLAFFFAVQGLCYPLLKLKHFPVLGAASLWVMFEWLRLWFLTGFPWLYLGYAFIDTPLAGYAPIGSVLLMSFVVCILAQLIFLGLDNFKAKPKHSFGCFLLILLITLLGLGLQHITWTTQKTQTPIRVSLIQGNIEQSIKWLPEHRDFTKQLYKDLSVTEWENYQPHLIIWPEAAIPALRFEVQDFVSQMQNLAIQNNSSLVTGLLFDEYDALYSQADPGWMPNIYNGVFAWGNAEQTYAKQRLVPFGEYIPLYDFFNNLLPFLSNFPRTGISAGAPHQANFKIGDYHFAPSICYEIVYPNLIQQQSKSADIIFTISNDGWFGNSHGPHQLSQMARMRALELGRYLLRATNTGITAIISPKGEMITQLPQAQRTVLRGEVFATSGQTPFGKFGLWPVLSLCFGLCLAGLMIGRNQSKANHA